MPVIYKLIVVGKCGTGDVRRTVPNCAALCRPPHMTCFQTVVRPANWGPPEYSVGSGHSCRTSWRCGAALSRRNTQRRTLQPCNKTSFQSAILPQQVDHAESAARLRKPARQISHRLQANIAMCFGIHSVDVSCPGQLIGMHSRGPSATTGRMSDFDRVSTITNCRKQNPVAMQNVSIGLDVLFRHNLYAGKADQPTAQAWTL